MEILNVAPQASFLLAIEQTLLKVVPPLLIFDAKAANLILSELRGCVEIRRRLPWDDEAPIITVGTALHLLAASQRAIAIAQESLRKQPRTKAVSALLAAIDLLAVALPGVRLRLQALQADMLFLVSKDPGTCRN